MTDIFDPAATVYAAVEGKIGRIVLNRPEKKNAMSEAMWRRVAQAVSALDGEADARAIILCSSSDGAFSAGADIGELEVIAADPERRESNRRAIRDAQRTLARASKPTIAQIAGPCVGGGCGLAIHCDFRFAAEGARFGITPAKLGIIYPLNDTKQLIDLVGLANAKRILFTGRLFSSAEAAKMGLIDERLPAGELAGAVHQFAEEMAAVSQYSLNGIKRSIQRILDGQVDDDEDTADMFLTAHEAEDAKEGVKAFLEKRRPNFTWTHDRDKQR